MASAYFEDHPTDPDKVVLRKPKHDYRLSPRHALNEARQRTWVGLTDEERKDLCRSWSSPMDAIYATEAKLKEKNT